MELSTGAAIFPAFDDFEYVDFQIYAITDAELDVMRMSNLPPMVLRMLMTSWFAELKKLPWIKILADKGDEILWNWRDQKIFTTEKTLTQVKTTFEENTQILTMLLGMRFQSEDIQFNKRRYIREKNKHLLLDEAVSELIDIAPELTKKLDQIGLIRRLVQKGGMQMRLVELKGDWYKKIVAY